MSLDDVDQVDDDDDGPAALFDVADEDLVPLPAGGNNLAHLAAAIAAGRKSGRLLVEDGALIRAAETAARSLDYAERAGGLKAGYLIAQTLRPYQDVLDRLGLNGRGELPPAPSGTGRTAALIAALAAGPTPGDAH